MASLFPLSAKGRHGQFLHPVSAAIGAPHDGHKRLKTAP
ncbi:hypothetical protein AH4AK4_1936 [Aeromonas hydrophila 4AK4]|nr:hypothetical protein AH4AK4_1936 [Aeromonas hydrophila 4AK4]